MEDLVKQIERHFEEGRLIIEWSDICITGTLETIFDTDNGFEDFETQYKEFQSCVLHVEKVYYKENTNIIIEIGDLIEISIENPPLKVHLEDGTIIWANKDTTAIYKINKKPMQSKEIVDFGKKIGLYYDNVAKKYVDTTIGVIHYRLDDTAYIVPAKPKRNTAK